MLEGGLSYCGVSVFCGLVFRIIVEYVGISGEEGLEAAVMDRCLLLTGSHS